MFFSGLLFFSSLLFAQSIETFKTMKFGEPIDFWTKWDANEYGGPGIIQMLITNKNEIIIQPAGQDFLYYSKDFSSQFKKIDIPQKGLDRYFVMSQIKGGYLVGYRDVIYENNQITSYSYSLLLNKGRKRILTFDLKKGESSGNFYYTSNILFSEVGKRNLISIELLSDGTNKVRGADETKSWLESGKGEEIGYKQELYENGQISDNYIGDIIVRTASNYYRTPVTTNVKMLSDKYSELTRMKDTGYSNLGKDGKGLVYYRKLEDENGLYNSDHPGKNIKFNIAVIDIWTRQVYFYEDYAANEWNPPRNSEGKVIGSYAWTVAPDGNIYFADADTDKGEYQIKRIPNRWYKDMGMEGRTIGQLNANHIPLAKEASAAAQNDGHCFENDFVWVKETKDAWSRIQKIDGRTGWVESKYIDIE